MELKPEILQLDSFRDKMFPDQESMNDTMGGGSIAGENTLLKFKSFLENDESLNMTKMPAFLDS